ncbi:MarR family winged helix-turn-helix transcriptional regulator [Paenibacillus senegalensis]|uniref:MarR family winged helix-turn-helix transcriptional regulator n=1 Tax=Paenibacillus senegalensis TaxID=1465766 RepID=UPI000287B04F|nr:MarR family transcriptional regulator [Paenibacillus senegalensis]
MAMNKPRLEQSIGFQLSITSRKLSHLFTLRLKPFRITPEQWLVLSCIREHNGIIQKSIAERTGKDRPTVTRILDSLARKNWIRKQADPGDRRSFLVFTTPAGDQLLEQTAGIEQHLVRQATEEIANHELEELFRQLLSIRRKTDSLILEEQEKENVRHFHTN